MASIFSDEGLDATAAVFPKNGTNYSSLYLGLFTSQTASTVPARSATGGASPSGWTEVTGTSYARIAVAAADWGSASTSGSGRAIAASQKTFTAGGTWTVANGFFLATLSASGSLDKVIYFANFDNGLARTLASGDTLKVTATLLMTQA